MAQNLYIKIANSNAYRDVRDELSGMIINDKTLLPELIAFALDINDKNHFKACWICELVFEKHIEWLQDYIDDFINKNKGSNVFF